MKTPAEHKSEAGARPAPPALSLVAAVTAVVATYAYFLIFAQFGFLRAVTAALSEGHALLRPVMAVMGAAGIAGSMATSGFWRAERARGWMGAGFLAAGGAAALAAGARTPPSFFVAAALTGLGTGVITVALATLLRGETGGEKLGPCLGLGTGTAYALCNLPPVFAAGPRTQAWLGVAAAGLGLVALRGFGQRATAAPRPAVGDYEPRGIAAWTLVLLALVLFDSAAFYVIQHTPGLKAATWTGSGQLGLNAGAHLGAAVLAGMALGRSRVGVVAFAATALLLGAHALIMSGHGAIGAPLYAAGVSAYSTLLVFYPAHSGRVALAALVYALAGWTGSALGIGLAEHRPVLPGWLPVATGVVVVTLLAALAWTRRRRACSKI